MNKFKIALSLAAMTLCASSVSALANSGQLTFTGKVNNSTCSVSGLNGEVVIPTLNKAEVDSAVQDAYLTHSSSTIDITGCPNTLTSANLSLDFALSEASATRVNLGQTTMKGVWMYFKTGTTGGSALAPNKVITIPLNAGAASYTFHQVLSRTVSHGEYGALKSVAGAFNVPVNLTMTYQ